MTMAVMMAVVVGMMVGGGLVGMSHTKIGTHLKPHLSQATLRVNMMSCQET
jgi:predicted RND superfamily exporter protein